jgi:acetyltransferase-like isoleucine patch superfamily enzyme
MGFLSTTELASIGFRKLGINVLISSLASIHNPELIEIGDNSRIDDFVTLSGRVCIGEYVHIAVGCNLAGGSKGIFIGDFCGFSYGVQIFTRVDDYSGLTLSNPTIPTQFKITHEREILIERHCKIGTYAIVLPGSTLATGCSFSAQSLIQGTTHPHNLYSGNPLKLIAPLSNKLLEVEKTFITWKREK